MCVHRLVWLGRGKWDFEHANSVGRRLAGWLLSQLHCLTRSLDFTPERNLNEKRKGRSSRARIPSRALWELPDMMSAKLSDFLTPFPLVHIWILFILWNSRNLSYYVRFCMTPLRCRPHIWKLPFSSSPTLQCASPPPLRIPELFRGAAPLFIVIRSSPIREIHKLPPEERRAWGQRGAATF